MADIPYDPELDNLQYVYRLQRRQDLLHMEERVGKNIAPSKWISEKAPHPEYVRIASELPETMAIYTLSVWRNERVARREAEGFASRNKGTVLMRIPRESIAKSDLKCLDDDALLHEAFLLYEVSRAPGEQVYGETRIPWSQVERSDPLWSALAIHPEENLYAVQRSMAEVYSIPQYFDNDSGLPCIEKLLRGTLRQLVSIEQELGTLPSWRFIRRAQLEEAAYSISSLWEEMGDEPAVRSAIRRLRSALPKDHAWRRHLERGTS